MSFQRSSIAVISLMMGMILVGCVNPTEKLKYLGDADFSFYKDQVTQIDFPVEETTLSDSVSFTSKPRVLGGRNKDAIWDMPLVEAVHLALDNNTVIRSAQSFGSPSNPILANGETAPSIFDPAIQESGVLFGRRGVEAALADFDTQFSTSILWGRNETVQNSRVFRGAPGQTLDAETARFRSSLNKSFANGGEITFGHDWDYTGTIGFTPTELFPSSYVGNLRADYRLPLLAGSGTEFTRIAGPVNPNFGAIAGVSQGVVIARINNDITLADFENRVRGLLKDVEDTYWDLYLNYRLYNTAITARNSALRSWREAKAKLDIGGVENFKPSDEAQVRDQYFETRSQAELALSNIYISESRLRRLIGLPVNDGKIIRPADEPVAAQFIPDWELSLAEALTERVELRKQKFTIKSLQLQLQAARSLTRPSLDFISGYRVNGFGDKLISQQDGDGITAQGLHSGYESLTQGNQTGWNLGLSMTMPLGFRSAKSQERNYELRLAKARSVLATQELEISHELGNAFQQLAANYKIAQSNFNRGRAALRRLELFDAEYNAGTTTLDLVLRAQTSLANAERSYYTSIIDYNKSITNLQYRKGTLLEHNNVQLAEGGWFPDAYRDAIRKAWARSHALRDNFLHSEPQDFAIPKDARTIDYSGVKDNISSAPPAEPEPVLPPQPENSQEKPAETATNVEELLRAKAEELDSE